MMGLLERARATPDAVAIESAAGTLTFARLADLASRGAAWLLARLAGGAAPVGILLPGDERFLAWFHAVALAGRTAIPLNTRLTAGELERQLQDAGAALLLGADDDARLASLTSGCPGLRVERVPDLEDLPPAPVKLPGARPRADATLAVIFTSGTTGRAKGACLSWGNFAALAQGSAERLGPAVAGRWLACMPMFHVGGLSIALRSVQFGGPVQLLPRFDAAEVSDVLDTGGIAGISLVPTMLSRLLAHRAGRASPPGLSVVLLGGAAAAPELVQRARAAGYPLCLTYGLTEACSQVATAAPAPPGATGEPAMLPLPGTEIRIVVDDVDVRPGEAGEILVRGPTVMRGYLDDAEATRRAIRDGWLHTGDIGWLDREGGLHVLDRRDDLIVSGGENVYPAEIEAVLLDHPAVEDAGVTGLPDADLGSRVVAWIVAAPGAAVDGDALADWCRSRLAGYKRPREFRFVAALPRTASGKLPRAALRGMEAWASRAATQPGQ